MIAVFKMLFSSRLNHRCAPQIPESLQGLARPAVHARGRSGPGREARPIRRHAVRRERTTTRPRGKRRVSLAVASLVQEFAAGVLSTDARHQGNLLA